MIRRARYLKNSTYEVFILALSVLSLFNLLLGLFIQSEVVDSVLFLINLLLSLIFLIDFVYRFTTTSARWDYFLRDFGWADLLASLPLAPAKLFRIFRLSRTAYAIRQYGRENLLRDLNQYRATSALLSVLFLIILVLEFGAMGEALVEAGDPSANIKLGSDAIWYVFVTIATVGYGDRYPVTVPGRLIGMLIMILGVGLFGVFTGFLANLFLTPRERSQPSSAPVPDPSDPRAKLAELRTFLAEQESAHAALRAKLAEMEALLDEQRRSP
jgi:voltage-gated potassium channel